MTDSATAQPEATATTLQSSTIPYPDATAPVTVQQTECIPASTLSRCASSYPPSLSVQVNAPIGEQLNMLGKGLVVGDAQVDAGDRQA